MITRLELSRIHIDHPTYHHFTGSGESDSDLDLLLVGGEGVSEHLLEYQCKLANPLMFSSHDLIVSTCSVPPTQLQPDNVSKLVTAPRVPNDRFCTKWSEDGVIEYSDTVAPLLPQIQETWGSEPSLPNISLLLSTTFMAMNVGAKATNKVVSMSDKTQVRPITPNPAIATAASYSKQCLLQLRMLQSSPQSHQDEIDMAHSNLQKSRYEFKKEVRVGLAAERDACDSFLHSIISYPSTVFKKLRASSRSSPSALKRLQVGDKVYSNERVPDGMFDSLNALKAPERKV